MSRKSIAAVVGVSVFAVTLIWIAPHDRRPDPVAADNIAPRVSDAALETIGNPPNSPPPGAGQVPDRGSGDVGESSRDDVRSEAMEPNLSDPARIGEDRSKVFSRALLGNLAVFRDVVDRELDDQSDAARVVGNHESASWLLRQHDSQQLPEIEVQCGTRICILDLFGSADEAQRFLRHSASVWPKRDGFLDSIIYLREGDGVFRFYLVAEDFPVEDLGLTK